MFLGTRAVCARMRPRTSNGRETSTARGAGRENAGRRARARGGTRARRATVRTRSDGVGRWRRIFFVFSRGRDGRRGGWDGVDVVARGLGRYAGGTMGGVPRGGGAGSDVDDGRTGRWIRRFRSGMDVGLMHASFDASFGRRDRD